MKVKGRLGIRKPRGDLDVSQGTAVANSLFGASSFPGEGDVHAVSLAQNGNVS